MVAKKRIKFDLTIFALNVEAVETKKIDYLSNLGNKMNDPDTSSLIGKLLIE